jgi:glycosyltransferase involved in cell wall biosynthesis
MTGRSKVGSVVIPVLNAAPMLERLLLELEQQTIREDLTLIVVDNGSADGSVEVAQRYSDVTLHEPQLGISYAKQRGLVEVDTPFVLSIDADCVPAGHDWAEVFVNGLEAAEDSVMGISGPVLPMPSDDRWSQRQDLTPASGWYPNGTLRYIVGGNHAYRTDLLHALGGYPTSAFAAEDAILGRVAHEHGYSFIWAAEGAVLHENPVGWRGYSRKMRQVARYHAALRQKPDSMGRFTAFHGARLVKCVGRSLRHGNLYEAAAQALKISGQIRGTWDVWR